MAIITFPLSLPAHGVRNVTLVPESSVAVAVSPFTFQSQVQVNQGQRWGLSFELAPLRRAQAAPWLAALTALNGMEGTFLFGDPYECRPRGIASGAPVADGAAQTGGELKTKGWTPGVNGVLKAGDMIGLGSGSASRLHRVLANADSDGNGKATIAIWPDLRESPADNAPIVTESPKGVFRMADNKQDMQRNMLRYGLTVTAIEVVP